MLAIQALALAATSLSAPAPPPPEAPDGFGEPMSDEALARETGKFTLPNGASLALSVTSDTTVNGVAVLRTVFTLDDAARVQVFGRDEGTAVRTERTVNAAAGAAAMVPSGVNVLFDRQSGTRIVSPTFTVGTGGTRVGPATDAAAAGLTPLAIAVGGPAVQTPDGLVMLAGTDGGAQVTLAGDRFGVAHLVGRSVATAIVNSANDRVFDTVSSVDIDLRDVAPFQLGSAAIRIDEIALDATRGMVR